MLYGTNRRVEEMSISTQVFFPFFPLTFLLYICYREILQILFQEPLLVGIHYIAISF